MSDALPDPLSGPVVLVLVAEPGDVPPAVRLKRLLKAMLRGYGFRCVHAGSREEREVVYVERPKASRKQKGRGVPSPTASPPVACEGHLSTPGMVAGTSAGPPGVPATLQAPGGH